jgi:hypothetical protein
MEIVELDMVTLTIVGASADRAANRLCYVVMDVCVNFSLLRANLHSRLALQKAAIAGADALDGSDAQLSERLGVDADGMLARVAIDMLRTHRLV